MTSSSQTNQPWPLSNLLKIATEKKEEGQASRVPIINQLKLHVCGAISRQGPGPYLIFYDIMARDLFEEEIIKRYAGPYVREVFLGPHCFFQGSHGSDLLPHHLSSRPGNMLSVNQEIPEELVQTDSALLCPLLAGQMSDSDRPRCFHATVMASGSDQFSHFSTLL
uniref:Uncharacterized protein n=1 Tax=Salmo trutta TaxID=8032 RepID=A0A674BYU5_SALTR